MLDFSFTPFPYLSTERLSLWQMELSDAPQVLALRSDDRVNKYIDRKKMLSIEEAEHFIDRINSGIESGVWIFWAVAEKHSNKFIGTLCLWNIVREEDKAELGYELIYDAQGNGYMQEAVPKVLEFGFQQMKLKTIEAVIKDGNDRSVKLIEKNGFTLSRKEDGIMIYTLQAKAN